jgi:hypothetical protein
LFSTTGSVWRDLIDTPTLFGDPAMSLKIKVTPKPPKEEEEEEEDTTIPAEIITPDAFSNIIFASVLNPEQAKEYTDPSKESKAPEDKIIPKEEVLGEEAEAAAAAAGQIAEEAAPAPEEAAIETLRNKLVKIFKPKKKLVAKKPEAQLAKKTAPAAELAKAKKAAPSPAKSWKSGLADFAAKIWNAIKSFFHRLLSP